MSPALTPAGSGIVRTNFPYVRSVLYQLCLFLSPPLSVHPRPSDLHPSRLPQSLPFQTRKLEPRDEMLVLLDDFKRRRPGELPELSRRGNKRCPPFPEQSIEVAQHAVYERPGSIRASSLLVNMVHLRVLLNLLVRQPGLSNGRTSPLCQPLRLSRSSVRRQLACPRDSFRRRQGIFRRFFTSRAAPPIS